MENYLYKKLLLCVDMAICQFQQEATKKKKTGEEFFFFVQRWHRTDKALASISCEHCRLSRNNPHYAPRHIIYYYNFYVPKTLNGFFSKQRFCARRARYLKKFSTDYIQIFYVYSKHKYLWSDKAVFNILNFIIIKLTKKGDFSTFFYILPPFCYFEK